ncbi:MAG: hypothetical protein QOD49_37 [Actinomycetota bacterium]|nr:hypothetical protein [Actinomycetota bacterium]
MGATAILDSPRLTADPGGEVTCLVKVGNSGRVVDEFTISVVGCAAGYTVIEPPTLSLLPGTEGAAVVHFRPPRTSDVAAGPVQFGVKVASKEDPAGSVVEEGVLTVNPFADVFAELVPRTAKGRRSAAFELALDNRGNSAVNATLDGRDPDQQLAFHVDPPAVVAAPNTATFAKVKVKPAKGFLKGPARTHQFQIDVNTEGAAPLSATGTMLQEALLPSWTLKAVAAALALLVAAAVLWATVLRPAITSAAQKAVAAPLGQAKTDVAALAGKEKQDVAAVQAQVAAGAAAGAGSSKGTGSQPAIPAVALAAPLDLRLPAKPTTFAPGQQATASTTVPSSNIGTTNWSITDLILENPRGDTGSVFIQRDNTVLLELRLENFRDLDYHFVTPIALSSGQAFTMKVSCENQAQPAAAGQAAQVAKDCTPGVYASGTQRIS